MTIDRTVQRSLLILSGLLLTACVSERVVLLPSPDGRQTAVVVRDAKGETLLDTPYAGVQWRGREASAYRSTAAEMQEQFGSALAAQPPRARSFVLYFEAGGDVLTAESQLEIKAIEREITTRPASEVLVIGHTDTVGSLEANDKLSLKRAAAAREFLIAVGIPKEKIEAAGRGEREPLVASGDEVAEPKNRRVEISVR